MKRAIVLIAVPLALLGCGQGGGYSPQTAKKVADAAVKPGDEASLLPLKVGNQWVYTVETGQRTGELTLKVVDVRTEGGATIATISSTLDNGSPSTSQFRVDSKGIYQLSDGSGRNYSRPMTLIAFPLEKGKDLKESVDGPRPFGGTSGPMESTIRYVGPQHADIVKDRIGALAVESVTTWQTDEGQAVSQGITWWTPGIGFVRQRQQFGVGQGGLTVLMKLKSHSFK